MRPLQTILLAVSSFYRASPRNGQCCKKGEPKCSHTVLPPGCCTHAAGAPPPQPCSLASNAADVDDRGGLVAILHDGQQQLLLNGSASGAASGDATWRSFDATAATNPGKSAGTGDWAGPDENIDGRMYIYIGSLQRLLIEIIPCC